MAASRVKNSSKHVKRFHIEVRLCKRRYLPHFTIHIGKYWCARSTKYFDLDRDRKTKVCELMYHLAWLEAVSFTIMVRLGNRKIFYELKRTKNVCQRHWR